MEDDTTPTQVPTDVIVTPELLQSVVPEYFLTNFVGPADTLDTEILTDQQNGSSGPKNQDWEGKYKFNISFEKEGKITKSIDWTFSPMVNKLYVTMGNPCPILFHTAKVPPAGSIIRAFPAYLKACHSSEVVQRCLQHRDPKDASNAGCVELADHLIRCEALHAKYQFSPGEQHTHRSVTVPYCAPEEGTDYICYVYKFMCYCSCTAPGINKRPVQIIFTLEHEREVLGRKVMDIRICAAPGRDRRIEEEKAAREVKMLASKRGQPDDNGIDSEKRWKAAGDDIYTLQVKGKKNYDVLKYLNDLMQFRDTALNIKEEDKSS